MILDFVFPGRREFPAHRSPPVVNRAKNACSDEALKRDAPAWDRLSAFHGRQKVVDLFGHIRGDAVIRCGIGLSPVKGDAKVRATCAAG